MQFEKSIRRLLVLALLVIGGTACQGEFPVIGDTPVPTRTLFPTSVPLTETPVPTITQTLRPSSTPLPTLTLPPSLTPVPTNTPTPGIIGIGFDTGPFRDDFSDPLSGWAVEGGADWGFGYFDGGYRMYSNIGYAEVCSSRTRSHTDFIIEVDAHKLSGGDNAYFGVSCRKTGENYYTIGITGNGEFIILKTTAGIPDVIASGPHPAIKKGNESNRLVASCIGNVLSLSVNGVEVGSVVDIGPLFGTFIGLVVGTTSIPEIEVKFDNFNSFPTGNAPPIPTLTSTVTSVPTMTPSATP